MSLPPSLTRLLPAAALAGALLGPAPAARAQETLAGTGRIAVLGGWGLAPNAELLERAAVVDAPPPGPSAGGPTLLAAFAYAPSELVEVGIELFASGERLWRAEPPGALAVSYGALLGVRAQWLSGPVGPFSGLQPSVGLHTGPTVVAGLEGGTLSEVVTQAWAASAGLTARLGPRWGLTLEYRYLLAQGLLAGRGPFEAGGHRLLVGATFTLPPEPGPGGWRG